MIKLERVMKRHRKSVMAEQQPLPTIYFPKLGQMAPVEENLIDSDNQLLAIQATSKNS